MTDHEAMQRVLEALDRVMSHGSAVQEAKDILRERLAQPEQHWIDELAKVPDHVWAQPEQEPVVWRAVMEDGTPTTDWIDGDGRQQTPAWPASKIQIAYGNPRPQQEQQVCCGEYNTCLRACTQRGRHLAQSEQEPETPTDGQRLDWLEKAADARKVELARSIYKTGYEIGEWPSLRVTVANGSLREAIDAAMQGR